MPSVFIAMKVADIGTLLAVIKVFVFIYFFKTLEAQNMCSRSGTFCVNVVIQQNSLPTLVSNLLSL